MKTAFGERNLFCALMIAASLMSPVFAQRETAGENKPAPNPPPAARKYLFDSPQTKRTAGAQINNQPAKNSPPPKEEKVVQISRAVNSEISNTEALNETEGTEKIDAGSVIAASSPEDAGIISNSETPENKNLANKTNKIAPAANLAALREKISAMPPTELYKVGIGDVLDIRLLNVSATDSTLYTILEGGILDFPLAGEPLNVSGLTTEEINLMLRERVKLYENPEIAVSVRDFASHKITILGAVEKSGVKSLRRDAVPLYVALAEAVPNAEAKTVTIIRADKKTETINLEDTVQANEILIRPNDIIKVSGSTAGSAATQFFFIIGAVNAAGQKDFHSGLTLTQGVFAAGGLTKNAGNRVVVMRQNSEGLLVTIEYNLKQIRDGKIPDPVLQAGDRIEVGN